MIPPNAGPKIDRAEQVARPFDRADIHPAFRHLSCHLALHLRRPVNLLFVPWLEWQEDLGMNTTPTRPTDPHPSDEEHYDLAPHPGGTHTPRDRDAGIEVHAHNGSQGQGASTATMQSPRAAPEQRPTGNATRTVMLVFVAVLVLVLGALWVTMSGVMPGDDGSEPTRNAPTVLPQP